ncbi:hypothetical protein G6F57_021898 [Rhizopus arrhizus]|nr:hypothetical protein G6F57_021898 [Rhizopus arrhizus]
MTSTSSSPPCWRSASVAAARTCSRKWSSMTSAVKPFLAPRAAASWRKISAHGAWDSSARSTPSNWPLMRRTRAMSLAFWA